MMLNNYRMKKMLVCALYIIIFISIYTIFTVMPKNTFADDTSDVTDDFDLGWVPPPQEIEDQFIAGGKPGVVISPYLPPAYILIDTMKSCSLVRNQGKMPSCVGFAVTSMMEYLCCNISSQEDPVELSPGYLYCKCKEREGNLSCVPGGGTSIYRAMDVLMEDGIPSEQCYPYSQTNMCCNNDQCSTTCRHLITERTFIDSSPLYLEKIAAMKSCLYFNNVFVAGLILFSNWDYRNPQNADIPEPNPLATVIGGHALCFVGYRDNQDWPGGGFFWFKNSWGPEWGYEGYGRVSYAYMQAFAREIVMVSQSNVTCSDISSPSCHNFHPPVLQGITCGSISYDQWSITAQIGEKLSCTIFAEDQDTDDTITFSLQNPPQGWDNCLNSGGEFNCAVPDKEGTYNLTIKAADSCGLFDTKILTIIVVDGCSSKDGRNGDLNKDGEITPQDAYIAFTCYLEPGICPDADAADVTNDGLLTPADALCIFRKYLGLPSCLDCN